VWLIALGAWLATSLGATDALVALRDAGDTVFVGLGSLLAVLSVLTLMATMGLNAYSAMLSAATAIDSFVPVKRTRTLRVVTISALAVIWLVASLAFGGEAVTALFNSLILMLYLLVPWTAINLVDYFFVRKGRYAIVELFVPDGLYGAWGRSGMTAYVIGLLAMVPFFVVPGTFMGPLAAQLGGVDISAIVGLVISAATYYALSRSLDVSAEGYAIARSTAQLAAEEG
jgi:purine-cytosine permease-like protein